MTLRHKTSLLLALIMTAAIGVTGVLTLHLFEKSIKNSILTGLEGISNSSSNAMGKFLNDTLLETQAVAMALPREALEQRDVALIQEKLQEFVGVFPKFENGMFILDVDGRLWVDYPSCVETRGQSFGHREYFQRTIREGKGIIGVPYTSARTGQPVLTFTALLRGTSNQVLGVLGCSARLLSSDTLETIRKTTIGQTGYIYVYDTTGLMILHPQNDRVLKRDVPPGVNRLWDAGIAGFQGTGETINSRGVAMIASVRRIDSTQWILVAQQPTREAFAPLEELRNQIFVSILLAVSGAIVLGALGVGKITAPLVRLRNDAAQLGHLAAERAAGTSGEGTHLAGKPPVAQGRDEIHDLVDVFEGMTHQLDTAMGSLKKSAKDWERTFDSVQDAIFILDREHRIQRLNKAAARLLKVEAQSARGASCFKLVHGMDASPPDCPYTQTLRTGKTTTREQKDLLSGRYSKIITTPIVDEDGTMVGCVHVISDITERKLMEEALRDSEKRYRELVDLLPQTVFEFDEKGIITFVNKNGFDTFGYSPEDFEKGVHVLSMISPEHHVRAIQNINLKLSSLTDNSMYNEYSALKKDGRSFPAIVYSTPIIKNNQPAGLRGILIDITEQKIAEEVLRENRNKFQALFELCPEAIFLETMEGRIIDCNMAAEKMTGYSREELLTMGVGELVPEEVTATLPVLREEIISAGAYFAESLSKRKNGEAFPVEVHIKRIDLSGEQAVLAVIRDITARKEAERERSKLEVQLRQAQKMEALGTLAGGIAHDFNNILAAMLGYTELALCSAPLEAGLRGHMGEVLKAGNRAKNLVRQILAFSRRSEQERKPIEIGGIVREALKLLRASLPATIAIHQNIGTDLGTVMADPTQIHQVLMNLCTNSAHAMRRRGGVLEVALDEVMVDANDPEYYSDLKPGSFLRLTVNDSGDGMSQEVLERIFDPFFTTKGPGEGTGMGLAVVYGIVRSCGGSISVHSTPGVGTRFTLLFPRAEFCRQAQTVTEPMCAMVRGEERILFVDDEASLVHWGEELLVKMGYEVTARTSSIEALKAFSAQPERFDLVITDQTMPNMTGLELVKKIRVIRPNIPILLCTGFSEMISDARCETLGIQGLLMKPVSMEELGRTIRKALRTFEPQAVSAGRLIDAGVKRDHLAC
jgi:PAS domain S-box-containing protein